MLNANGKWEGDLVTNPAKFSDPDAVRSIVKKYKGIEVVEDGPRMKLIADTSLTEWPHALLDEVSAFLEKGQWLGIVTLIREQDGISVVTWFQLWNSNGLYFMHESEALAALVHFFKPGENGKTASSVNQMGEDLRSELKCHDWYYNYSDGGNVWRRGNEHRKKIDSMFNVYKNQVGTELAHALWNEYAPHDFQHVQKGEVS